MHASNAAATPISTGRRFGHRVWGPDLVATYRCSSVSHMYSIGGKPSANYIETRRLSTFQIEVGVVARRWSPR
jgi:hypothetical protein